MELFRLPLSLPELLLSERCRQELLLEDSVFILLVGEGAGSISTSVDGLFAALQNAEVQ